MKKTALLETFSISGGYGRERIVKNVSLAVGQGDFMGIIGPNGSGKTTFLRLISKALAPAEGQVFLDGLSLESIRFKEFSRKVAFVQQDTQAAFPFSVLEVVLMGRYPYLQKFQGESSLDREIAMRAISMTDTLHLKHKNIGQLSLGERQRVLIAKSLAQQPKLLLLDEPTSHLDIAHQVQIMDLLSRQNQEEGLSIVMVIHDLNLASLYCNKIVLFDQGKIVRQGSAQDVITYQNIESVYKTVVVVYDNPITKRPCVFLVPKEKKCAQQ
ncbi:MAG: ABC transporter ATP-binding protein [Candidatus Omnitrophica bacterium]|jgi:iron complex transport system ATP-binding protein|nr:ABC transporter ATP-binding protein [Candidatus Omnitrophota bacterium]